MFWRDMQIAHVIRGTERMRKFVVSSGKEDCHEIIEYTQDVFAKCCRCERTHDGNGVMQVVSNSFQLLTMCRLLSFSLKLYIYVFLYYRHLFLHTSYFDRNVLVSVTNTYVVNTYIHDSYVAGVDLLSKDL